MKRGRLTAEAGLALAAALATTLVTPARPSNAQPAPAASRPTAANSDAPDPAALAGVLAALGGDLVTFLAAAPAVRVSTLALAEPTAIEAVLRTPEAFRTAIPALERAQVVDRRRRAGGGDEQQLVAWELEIPLANLKGKMWVGGDRQRVTLELVEGDFSPGRLTFTWAPVGAGRTVVTLEAAVNAHNGGWLIKRVAGRSPHAPAAINATTAFVALRAAVALAEHPRDVSARRAQAAPAPPALAAVDGRALAQRMGDALQTGAAALGVVQRAPSQRLALITIAAPSRLPPAQAVARLAAPETWRAFPGWKKVERVPPTRGSPADTTTVEVRDNIPFIDFDARWALARTNPPRAQATEGDGRGAILGWDVIAGSPSSAGCVVAFSLYPRIEKLGYVPRKFIAAEPLLEHGLALALAYVNAQSAREAIEAQGPPPAPQ